MGAMNIDDQDTKDEASTEVSSDSDGNICKPSLLLSSFSPHSTSLAFLESLSMPLVHEVVISADIGCAECQKRISNVISRFSAEMESVVVSLSEKKVIITCNYLKSPVTQISTGSRNVFNKVSLIKRMFRSSKS